MREQARSCKLLLGEFESAIVAAAAASKPNSRAVDRAAGSVGLIGGHNHVTFCLLVDERVRTVRRPSRKGRRVRRPREEDAILTTPMAML